MDNEFSQAKSTLIGIAKKIDEQTYQKYCLHPEWSGADVLITSKAGESVGNGDFYPQLRTVVTPFSCEVSWLFNNLRDAFDGLIDGTSKIEFYGRLANAAREYQQSVNGDGNAQDMLRAVLYEAFVMLEEMEEGTFEYLSIASGNTILADLVKKAEESGYIGVEATKEFFKRMEEKHRES